MKKISLILLGSFYLTIARAQQPIDSIKKIEEEDFSQYANVEVATSNVVTKKYCSQKIVGLSPAKLISIGYDYVGNNELGLDTFDNIYGNQATILNNSGVRLAANFPVISNNKMILNLGFSYLDFKYRFKEPINNIHPFNYTLAKNGLRSYGLNGTLFKPLNETHFLILQSSLDLNGDFALTEFPISEALKVSGALLYGFKPHERLQYAFGVTRTYRAGEVNYLPIFLYNYTFKNKKWGIEMLLPARANVRYTFNARNMLFAGFELEGNSYALTKMTNDFNLIQYKNLQLRRSEIRARITYERSLYKFIWISLQAGYRINYNMNIDNGEFYRGFGDKPYLLNNSLSSALYFNFSLNLVSP